VESQSPLPAHDAHHQLQLYHELVRSRSPLLKKLPVDAPVGYH
jgi:hypothetical protein